MLRPAALLTLMLIMPCGLFAETPPYWVQRCGLDFDTYPSSRYLTGYGVSSPGGAEIEQRNQAVAMAQASLASSIRTHVTSEFTSQVAQHSQGMSKFVRNLVRTNADIELDGLDTVQVWADTKGKIIHALAILDKEKTLHLLSNKLDRQARECTSTFIKAKGANDGRGLLQARHLRERLEEGLLVRAVLGEIVAGPPCPTQADIDQELRKVIAGQKGLDGFVAMAALDLGSNLPRGTRVLIDRITYADTPFCGTLSAFLEQSLGTELVACGQVKVIDKGSGRNAIREGGMDGSLVMALHSQAVVRGVCFDLGEEIQINLRITDISGEELTATTVKVPSALIKKAGLKLVPDNFEDAQKTMEICNAKIQATKLIIKVALDRGDGGIYRTGEKLYLFLKANMDCFVKVIYHQVDGTNVVVFPNRFHPDSKIQKDRLYQIPPDDNSFNLEVMGPFGVEVVKVIACTEVLDSPIQAPVHSELQIVREELAALVGQARSIRLRKAEAQYAEATAVVNTMDLGKP